MPVLFLNAARVGRYSDNPTSIRDFLGIDPRYVLGIYLRSAAARNRSEAAQRAQEAEGGGLSESQLEWLSTALSFFPPTMPVMAASDTVQFLERIRKGEQLSGSEYIFAAVGVFGGVKSKPLFGIGRELGAITAADRRLVVGHFGPQYSGIVERILTSIPPLSAEDAKLVATGLEKLRRGQPPTPQATAKIIDFFGKIRDMMRNANARAMGIADLLSPGTRSRVTVGVGEVIVPGKKPIKLVSTSEPNTIRRAVAETVPPGQLQIGVGHAEHQIITALEDMFGIQLTGVLATSRPHCPLCKAEMKGKIIPASLFRKK